MERLTRPCQDTMDGKYIDYVAGTYTGIYPNCTLGRVVDRLAAYENTGLEPEYIPELLADAKAMMGLLKYYEDLEEQGRLVVLPCKVGDTLYRICRFKRGKNWTKEAEFIRAVQLNQNTLWRIVFGGEFGKTVFLTREEADAALERQRLLSKLASIPEVEPDEIDKAMIAKAQAEEEGGAVNGKV